MLGNFISEMQGPDFLSFHFSAGFGALILTAILRYVVRTKTGDKIVCSTDTNPYYISWLRGGEKAMALTAACHLMSKGLIESHGANFRMVALNDQPPGTASELDGVESVVWEKIKSLTESQGIASGPSGSNPDITVADLAKDDLIQSLELEADRAEFWALEVGLIVDRFGKLLVWVPLILWMVVGLYKLGLGVSIDRPVGDLGSQLFVGLLFGGAWVSSMSKLTRRGEEYLKDLQTLAEGYSEIISAERCPVTASRNGRDPAFIFAVGALGTGFLAGTQMDLFASSLPTTMQAAASSSGSYGCGGGSGCGGGGCGGGGCGGCGG